MHICIYEYRIDKPLVYIASDGHGNPSIGRLKNIWQSLKI